MHCCLSFVPFLACVSGTRNTEIALLFRAIGSHYLNHFSVVILHGEICSSLDDYKCGNLYPVSEAWKFSNKKGVVHRVKRVRGGNRGTIEYPLSFLEGRGSFTQVDFPVTYLKWEEQVRKDPILNRSKLSPQYDYDNPVCVAFFKKGLSQKARACPLPGPVVAATKEKLKGCTYRVVNFDGCAIPHIAQSARKHGFAMIMAMSGYCQKFPCVFASYPERLRTIICHFVRAIMVAGLPQGMFYTNYKHMCIFHENTVQSQPLQVLVSIYYFQPKTTIVILLKGS